MGREGLERKCIIVCVCCNNEGSKVILGPLLFSGSAGRRSDGGPLQGALLAPAPGTKGEAQEGWAGDYPEASDAGHLQRELQEGKEGREAGEAHVALEEEAVV